MTQSGSIPFNRQSQAITFEEFETILHRMCFGIFSKKRFTSATSRSCVFFAISWTCASKIVSFGEPLDARQLPCLTELACEQKTICLN